MSSEQNEPMPGLRSGVDAYPGGDIGPDAFWNDFLGRMIRTTGSAMVLVLVGQGVDWKVIRRAMSGNCRRGEQTRIFEEAAPRFAGRLVEGEGGVFELEADGSTRVVGRLFSGLAGGRSGAVFLLFPEPVDGLIARAEGLIGFAVDAPVAYDLKRQLVAMGGRLERLLAVVDGVAAILPRPRFRDAAITLCNRIAVDLGAELVFLGWSVSGSAKVVAISRTESFNRKMNLVEAVEKAMDECLDQEDPVTAPALPGSNLVNRVHAEATTAAGFGNMLSVPLKDGEETVAVVTVQRTGRPFDETELEKTALLADLVSPRLCALRRTDRWFGARIGAGARRWCAGIVGPTHTWTKVLALLGTVILGFLLFYKMPHRVEGSFTLKSDRLRNVPSPFDGYLAEVLVAPGDEVAEGQVLAHLDDEDIRLERDAAAAEVRRYEREAEMARVRRNSAEMRIAEAMAAEAKARLEVAEYRLARTTLRSPVNGVVLEGDLRERIDAPVRQGDLLFTLAPPGPLYADATVRERDIHRVWPDASGEIALVARPEERIPCQVTLIEPSAAPGEAGNIFTVRLDPLSQESWWRPGMGGVVKIDGEEKPLIHILTYRTVDFLRMYFWF